MKFCLADSIGRWRYVAPYTGAWIEISKNTRKKVILKSHPTRVRGLKYDYSPSMISSGLSHPTRVRGLKLKEYFTPCLLILSHPTRVRGLKLTKALLSLLKLMSHPTRVRGLKCLRRCLSNDGSHVAPYTGAWIEISHFVFYACNKARRTLHGCVD